MSQDITTMADGFTNGVHHPLAIYMGIHIPYQMIFNGEPELLDFPNRRMIKSQLSHMFPISAVQFYERPHFQTLTLQFASRWNLWYLDLSSVYGHSKNRENPGEE